MIGALAYLNIEPLEEFFPLEGDLYLTNKSYCLQQEFLQGTFVKAVGQLEIDFLSTSINVFQLSDLSQTPANIRINLEIGLSNHSGYLHRWLLALWFIKDNSVNIKGLHAYLVNNGSETVKSHFSEGGYSNAVGEYAATTFTPDELKQAIDWLSKINKYLKKEKEVDNVAQDELEDVTNVKYITDDSHELYESSNRFSRALRFIIVARRESFLPQ